MGIGVHWVNLDIDVRTCTLMGWKVAGRVRTVVLGGVLVVLRCGTRRLSVAYPPAPSTS